MENMKRSCILFLLVILISSCSLSPQQVALKTDTATPDIAALWTATSPLTPTRTPEPTLTQTPAPSPTATTMPTPSDTATPTLPPGYDIVILGDKFNNYPLLFDTSQWEKIIYPDQIYGMLQNNNIQNCTMDYSWGLPEGGQPTYTEETRSIGENQYDILLFTGGGHFIGVYTLLNDEGNYTNTVLLKIEGKGDPSACIKAGEQTIFNSAAFISIYK